MAPIDTVILEVADVAAARRFCAALGVEDLVGLRQSDAPTSGFRGFTLSLTVPRPADVDHLLDAARDAGGEVLKAAEKSFWGYGGSVRAPDGSVWTVASSSKKDTGEPPTGTIESVVLQLGPADVRASKRFYVEQGLEVAKSFGSRYVEFAPAGGPVTLTLTGRRTLAKVAGVPAEGDGSHRLVLVGEAGPGTDPDGFVWERSGAPEEGGHRIP